MPRPTWKGHRRLSLVSCPVALYTASSSSERVSFNTLNRKTGNRLKQNLVDSVNGEPVDTADRVKGYQVAKGQYVMVEDTDLEALRIESTKTLEIETFVPAAEIDGIYLDSPYYLAPDGKMAEEAFAVIREAMAKKKVAGIGRVVLSRRERLLMLQPRGPGMLATTLRYPYEVRQDAEYFEGISERKVAPAMLDIAQEIIGRMSGHFEPDSFADRYEEAVTAMLQAKQAGQSFAVPETAEPDNVVDIMDALKRSLQAGGAPPPRPPGKKNPHVGEPPAQGAPPNGPPRQAAAAGRRGAGRGARRRDRAQAARRPSRRGAAYRGSVGRAGARDRGAARRALGPAHHAPADAPGAEGAQPRRSPGRGGRGGRTRRSRHGREPLHHGHARRFSRSGAALQSRQRVPGTGPRDR